MAKENEATLRRELEKANRDADRLRVTVGFMRVENGILRRNLVALAQAISRVGVMSDADTEAAR